MGTRFTPGTTGMTKTPVTSALNTVAVFQKPDALLGKYDEQAVNELHMRLNALFTKIKKQSPKLLKEMESKQKDMTDMGKNVWATPTFVLIYLANAIERFAPKPVYGDNPARAQEMSPAAEEVSCKLVKWAEFKQLLFEIYDHRIEYAPEINGAVNNTYLALEEHLIMFFMEKYRDQKRSRVEEHLLEFLATLKYYSDYWKRAKSFAVMYGFLKSEDSFLSGRRSCTSDARHPQRLNDGRPGELEVPNTDIYVQEFFLTAYNIVTNERASFLESTEGFTYVPFRMVDLMTQRLLNPVINNSK